MQDIGIFTIIGITTKRRYADIVLVNAQFHNSSCRALHGRSESDFHQAFYCICLWVVLCVL